MLAKFVKRISSINNNIKIIKQKIETLEEPPFNKIKLLNIINNFENEINKDYSRHEISIYKTERYYNKQIKNLKNTVNTLKTEKEMLKIENEKLIEENKNLNLQIYTLKKFKEEHEKEYDYFKEIDKLRGENNNLKNENNNLKYKIEHPNKVKNHSSDITQNGWNNGKDYW